MEINIQDEKMAFENAWLVPHELEFFDFDLKKNQYLLKEQYVSDDESPIANETYHSLNSGWSMWLKAKAHEAEKLNGCVVVPVDSLNKTIDAIENMFEEDPTLTLGDLLPVQQDIKAMLEAARGGNE